MWTVVRIKPNVNPVNSKPEPNLSTQIRFRFPSLVQRFLHVVFKQDKMADSSARYATFTFGGNEYTVSMSVQDGSQLTVQVEEQSSTEQWRNTFDVNCKFIFQRSLHCWLNYHACTLYTCIIWPYLHSTCFSAVLWTGTVSVGSRFRHHIRSTTITSASVLLAPLVCRFFLQNVDHQFFFDWRLHLY